MLELQAQFNN